MSPARSHRDELKRALTARSVGNGDVRALALAGNASTEPASHEYNTSPREAAGVYPWPTKKRSLHTLHKLQLFEPKADAARSGLLRPFLAWSSRPA
jgi:hypothetical protein